jgi:hypothetical protein
LGSLGTRFSHLRRQIRVAFSLVTAKMVL